MYTIDEIKSKGIQKPNNNIRGQFHLTVESIYFGQQVELIFTNQNNNKSLHDWNTILKQANQFIKLNENVIGWLKDILWENYLYAIEGTDYGFDEIKPSDEIYNLNKEEITILKDMPTANLETIKFNMNHFKIFHKNQILSGTKIELVELRKETITFFISTIWDDEHDLDIHTKNYNIDENK